jgi:uncharacterized protein
MLALTAVGGRVLHAQSPLLRLVALSSEGGDRPRRLPALDGDFRLDWSCGYLYEEPAARTIPTCGRPSKDSMQHLIDRVRAAAEIGSAYDQFILGMAYWQGDRAPHDPVRGLMWLSLAAAQDQGAAAAARAALAAELSAAEVAEAERLARRWLAHHRADR